jgi:hypothetical protein
VKAPTGYTAAQVAASLAANPFASTGGFMGQPADAAAGAAGSDSGLDPYNFLDPILQRIQALSTQSRIDAQSNALKLRREAAIDYGSAEAAGLADDQTTQQAANDNPFSILSELKRNYDRGLHDLDESLNQQGLVLLG